jgi:hypothetical protein
MLYFAMRNRLHPLFFYSPPGHLSGLDNNVRGKERTMAADGVFENDTL